MTVPFLTGFGLGLSLIFVIGAQNAFVLRQGIARQFVLPVVLTCAVSDAILIIAGVYGFGEITKALPNLVPIMTIGGAIFLFVYGGMSFRSAWRGTGKLEASERKVGSLVSTLLICLALTWGNPHVYLDTVVLLGSIATKFEGQRVAFGAGAVLASFFFFFSLGYGARFLAPYFEKPIAWRALDIAIGLFMWSLAFSLIRSL